MSRQLWVALMKRNLDRRFYLLFLCTIIILAFHLYVSFASEPPLTDSLLISISDETGFLGLTENEKHPIELLVEEANQKFQNITEQQSRSLKDAVLEYRRRYRREPPPGFNHWYDAAVGSNTTVIDNFDTIMAAFEPYWAFSAQEIRARVQDLKDAQGWKVYIIKIDNHTQEVSVSHTQDVWASYKYDITMDWIKTFIEFLPSMEIAFTSTDEPRNVVPREELDNAMSRCPDQHRRHVPRRPPVQFEDHAYRKHYEVSTVSCPPKHSSHISNPNPLPSNGLCFVRNITRAQDVCENPKVADLHGGFGPSYSIKILNSLHPLFSRAKLSSYQDLLFPAPDYVSGSYPKYNESQDMPWEQKDNRLYWAGSTTGAEASKDTGWQNWQRERLVQEMNNRRRTVPLLKQNPKHLGRWEPYNGTMKELSQLVDISFTNTAHCDASTCTEMDNTLHFSFLDQPSSAAYENRFVMDIDGNGFTERFYRLLKSNSTVFKMTMFQEWHDDRLVPWVHYVPISLEMKELPETLRFLADTERGREIAKKIGEQGSVWAKMVLREEDLRLAMWRILLEYGRLYDGRRDRERGAECPFVVEGNRQRIRDVAKPP